MASSVVRARADGNDDGFVGRTLASSVWARWVVGTCFVLLGGLAAFFRLPPVAQGTVWAEDGGIFLNDALSGSGWRGIFQPYEGYLHVIPRLAANAVVSLLPVDEYALAMSLTSCLVAGIVALMVFDFSKTVCANWVIRLCWASITVLIAPGPLETLGNYANIHWYFLWLAPWLLLRPSKSPIGALLLLVTGLLVSLTEILAIIFTPLILYRFPDRSLWAARVGLVLGLACQVATTFLYPRSPSSGYPVNPLSVLYGWILNSSSAILYGNSETIASHVRIFGAISIIFSAIIFLFIFALSAWKGRLCHRIAAITMLLASGGTWLATQVANPQPFFDYARFTDADWGGFFLSRYSTAPSMFLVALIPLAAAVWLPLSRLISGVLIGFFLVLQLVFFFPEDVSRSDGPLWSDGVADARHACHENKILNYVSIPIAPRGWFADKVNVQCAKLN